MPEQDYDLPLYQSPEGEFFSLTPEQATSFPTYKPLGFTYRDAIASGKQQITDEPSISKTAAQMLLGLRQGYESSMPKSVGGGIEAIGGILPEDYGGKALRKIGREGREGANQIGQEYEELGKGVGGGVAGELARSTGSSVVPSAAALLAAAPLGVLGASAGAVTTASAIASGLQSFGGTYGDAFEAYKKQGLSDTEAYKKSYAPAVASGLVTGLITKGFGGTGLEKALIAKSVPKGFGKAAFEVAKDVGFEVIEEGSDEAWQSVVRNLSFNPEATAEDNLKSILQAGIAGGLMAGAVRGVQSAPSAVSDLFPGKPAAGPTPPPIPTQPAPAAPTPAPTAPAAPPAAPRPAPAPVLPPVAPIQQAAPPAAPAPTPRPAPVAAPAQPIPTAPTPAVFPPIQAPRRDAGRVAADQSVQFNPTGPLPPNESRMVSAGAKVLAKQGFDPETAAEFSEHFVRGLRGEPFSMDAFRNDLIKSATQSGLVNPNTAKVRNTSVEGLVGSGVPRERAEQVARENTLFNEARARQVTLSNREVLKRIPRVYPVKQAPALATPVAETPAQATPKPRRVAITPAAQAAAPRPENRQEEAVLPELVASTPDRMVYEVKGPRNTVAARFDVTLDLNGVWRPTPGSGFEILDESLRGRGIGEAFVRRFADTVGPIGSTGLSSDEGTSPFALKMWKRIGAPIEQLPKTDPSIGSSKAYVLRGKANTTAPRLETRPEASMPAIPAGELGIERGRVSPVDPDLAAAVEDIRGGYSERTARELEREEISRVSDVSAAKEPWQMTAEEYGLRDSVIEFVKSNDKRLFTRSGEKGAGIARRGERKLLVQDIENPVLRKFIKEHEEGHYLYEDLQNVTVADIMQQNPALWSEAQQTSAVKSHWTGFKDSPIGVDWVEALADMRAELSARPELGLGKLRAWMRSVARGSSEHRAAVEAALREGKPVPPAVLADYPELAQKAEPAKAPVATPSLSTEEVAALRITQLKGVSDRGDGIFFIPEKVMTAARRKAVKRGGRNIEVKAWADVTGNPSDRGYAILDRRARNAARSPATAPPDVQYSLGGEAGASDSGKEAAKTARPWTTTATYSRALNDAIKPGDDVLDYGSGPYQLVAPKVVAKGATYTPYDKYHGINLDALSVKRDVVMGSNVLNVQSKFGDPEASYNNALDEMASSLKPDGKLVVNMPSSGPLSDWMTPKRLQADLLKRFNSVVRKGETFIASGLKSLSQQEQNSLGQTPSTRPASSLSVMGVEKAVRELFPDSATPPNFQVTHNYGKVFNGREVRGWYDPSTGTIWLNAAYLRSPQEARMVFAEEAMHAVQNDPAVKEAMGRLVGSLSEQQLAEKRAAYGNIPQEQLEMEAVSDFIRDRQLRQDQMGLLAKLWDAVLGAVQRLYGKFTGKVFTERDAQDVLAKALKAAAVGRRSLKSGGEVYAEGGLAAKAKAFFSRLFRTVEQSQQNKASGAQWKATIKNSKLGANLDEMALVGVNDLEDGKVYSRQEVLDYLQANQVEVKDVTLGGEYSGPAVVPVRYDSKEVDEIPKNQESDEPITVMAHAYSDGRDDIGEVREYPGGHYQNGYPFVAYDMDGRSEGFNSLERAEEWLGRNIEQPSDPTHFSTYQLPGAKEGSYREVLLTAPSVNVSTEEEQLTSNTPVETRQNVYGDKQWYLVNRYGEWGDVPYTSEAEAKAVIADPKRKTTKTVTRPKFDWRDGHQQYDNIVAPIVRLRFNERTTQDGKRMLFLEEVQPPQTDNFEKMPALFQKNWREIAFKWALRHAAENGFEVVGWTTGAQQAERYRDAIIKEVSSVEWSSLSVADTSTGKLVLTPSSEKSVSLELKSGGSIDVAVDSSGKVIRSQNNKSGLPLIGKGLDEIIGKPMAEKILSEPKGKLEEAGIEVGGEGLKKLYDVDFRNVVGKLPAVRNAGGKVGMAEVTTDNKPVSIQERGGYFSVMVGPSDAGRFGSRALAEAHAATFAPRTATIHALPITPAIADSVMGGQAMFSTGSPQNQLDQKYFEAIQRGDMQEVQALVDEAARAGGWNIDAMHGTTHEFFSFSRDKANVENDLGSGFYLTNTEADVSENYAGVGPDLTNRIERLAETYEAEGIPRAAALKSATKKLAGGNQRVINAKIRFSNPVILDGNGTRPNGTRIELMPDIEQYRAEAIERVKDANPNANDANIEDYADEVQEAMYDLQNEDYSASGPLEKIRRAVESFEKTDFDSLLMDLSEEGESIEAYRLEQILRKNDGTSFALDGNSGDSAVGELIRRVFEALGYDGIIDKNVNTKFGSKSRQKPMAGMGPNTVHYIAFDPTQIKSADPITRDDSGNIIPLSQRFQQESPDIRYSLGAPVSQSDATEVQGRAIEPSLVAAASRSVEDLGRQQFEEFEQAGRQLEGLAYESKQFRQARSELNNLVSLHEGRLRQLPQDRVTDDMRANIRDGVSIENFQIIVGDELVTKLAQMGVQARPELVKAMQAEVHFEQQARRLVDNLGKLATLKELKDYYTRIKAPADEILKLDKLIAAKQKVVANLTPVTVERNGQQEFIGDRASDIIRANASKVELQSKRDALTLEPVQEFFGKGITELRDLSEKAKAAADLTRALMDSSTSISEVARLGEIYDKWASFDATVKDALKKGTLTDEQRVSVLTSLQQSFNEFDEAKFRMDDLFNSEEKGLLKDIRLAEADIADAKVTSGLADILVADALKAAKGEMGLTGTVGDAANIANLEASTGAITTLAMNLGRTIDQNRWLYDFLVAPGAMPAFGASVAQSLGISETALREILKVVQQSPSLASAIVTLTDDAAAKLAASPPNQMQSIATLATSGNPVAMALAANLTSQIVQQANAQGTKANAARQTAARQLAQSVLRLRTLQQGQALFNQTANSPAFQQLRKTVSMGASEAQGMVVLGPTGPVLRGFKSSTKDYQPELKINVASDALELQKTREKVWKYLQNAEQYVADYEAAAAAYAANPANPSPSQLGFDVADYNGLKFAIENQIAPMFLNMGDMDDAARAAQYLTPVGVRKLMKAPAFLGQIFLQHEQLGKMIGGFAGNIFRQQVAKYKRGYLNAKKVASQFQDLPKLQSAAMQSHNIRSEDTYRKIFNEMAHYGRLFGTPLRTGFKLPTSGQIVTKEDMEFFKRTLAYEERLRRDVTEIDPVTGVRYKRGGKEVTRKGAYVGDLGMPRHLNRGATKFIANVTDAYAGTPKGFTPTTDLSANNKDGPAAFWNKNISTLKQHILDSLRTDRSFKQTAEMAAAEKRIAARWLAGNMDQVNSVQDLVDLIAAEIPTTNGKNPLDTAREGLNNELLQYVAHAERIQKERAEDNAKTSGLSIALSSDNEYTKPAAYLELPSEYYDYGAVSSVDRITAQARANHSTLVDFANSIRLAITELQSRMDQLRAVPITDKQREAILENYKSRQEMEDVLELLQTSLKNFEDSYRAGGPDIVPTKLGQKAFKATVGSVLAGVPIALKNLSQGQIQVFTNLRAMNYMSAMLAAWKALSNVPRGLINTSYMVARNIAGFTDRRLGRDPQFQRTLKGAVDVIADGIFLTAQTALFKPKVGAENVRKSFDRVFDLGFDTSGDWWDAAKQAWIESGQFRNQLDQDEAMKSRTSRALHLLNRLANTGLDTTNAIVRGSVLESSDTGMNALSLGLSGSLEQRLEQVAMVFGKRLTDLGITRIDPTDKRAILQPIEWLPSLNQQTAANSLGEIRKFLESSASSEGFSLEQNLLKYYQDKTAGRPAEIFNQRTFDAVQRSMIAENNAALPTNRASAGQASTLWRTMLALQGYPADASLKLLRIATGGSRDRKKVLQAASKISFALGFAAMAIILTGSGDAGAELWKRIAQGKRADRPTPLDADFYKDPDHLMRAMGNYILLSVYYLGDAIRGAYGFVDGRATIEPSQKIFAVATVSQIIRDLYSAGKIAYKGGTAAEALDPLRRSMTRLTFGVPELEYLLGKESDNTEAAKRGMRENAKAKGFDLPAPGFGGTVGLTNIKRKALSQAVSDMDIAKRKGDTNGYNKAKAEARKQLTELEAYYLKQRLDAGDSREVAAKTAKASVWGDYQENNPVTAALGGKRPTAEQYKQLVESSTGERGQVIRQGIKAWQDGAQALFGKPGNITKEDVAENRPGGTVREPSYGRVSLTGGVSGRMRSVGTSSSRGRRAKIRRVSLTGRRRKISPMRGRRKKIRRVRLTA